MLVKTLFEIRSMLVNVQNKNDYLLLRTCGEAAQKSVPNHVRRERCEKLSDPNEEEATSIICNVEDEQT